MMKGTWLIVFLVFCFTLTGQTVPENLSGNVSFISNQNIYVKFKSTEGIAVGDTLYSSRNGTLVPALIVNNLSSSSVVGTPLIQSVFSIADVLVARVKSGGKKIEPEELKVVPVAAIISVPEADSVPPATVNSDYTQRIRGSISANSYTDLSNTVADNSQRYRYTFSLDAANISSSKFSVESYMSFKYKAGQWQAVQDNIFSALKIYNLAVRYDLNKTTKISVGRRIDPKISNIGAMDGVQFEKTTGRFGFGALIGSRPDYQDYSFDFSLFQYGAYAGFSTKTPGSYSESSMAFMQQTNSGKTDRRFVYFQHSNTLVKNLYFFGTGEVDLYQLVTDSLNNEKSNNNLSFTGIYLSLSYRPGSKLSVSGSYDARKNVVYYETYKTYVDRILEDELRQGFRALASYRITRDLTFGLQAGYRYLKSDRHPSRNIYGYFTYSNVPGVNISATVSSTFLESSYINGNIYSLNLSRNFSKGKIYTGVGYRYVDYRLPESSLDMVQNIGELNISWQIFEKTSMSVSYEGTFEQEHKYNRIYLQLRKRF